ncbi:MAG TPA: tetratricopeptide repeat protein [Chitinivibrionales bacterium]
MKEFNTAVISNATVGNTIEERVAMYIRIVRFGVIILTLSLYCFCQKADLKNGPVVKIGSTTINQKEYNTFLDARGIFPSPRGDYFSRPLSDMTFLITTELLYDKAASTSFAAQAKNSDDWKWKQMYYPATLFLRAVIQGNLGSFDKEIEAYYKAHRESYSHLVPRDTASKVKDTLHKKEAAKTAKVDSIKAYRPLEEVRQQVIEALFLEKNPAPDSLFRKKDPKDTTKIDSLGIRTQWLYSTKRTFQDFYLAKCYQEKYKSKLPDSLNQWYGNGKIITPADMKVIMTWIPEEQRGYYSNPNGALELAKWLLRWKLFSEKAKKSWAEGQNDIKAELDCAWKLNVVFNYVNSDLTPKAKKAAVVDTAMCVYACWDEHGNPTVKPDSASIAAMTAQYAQRMANMDLDNQIYQLRKKREITILQNDFKDDMSGNPATMSAHADSLRDTGKTDEAEGIYRTPSSSFAFTPEGMRAFVELAKIQTEKQQYTEAIKNYREYLVLSNDKSKRCNTFFMIGFIYDEYLNRPDDASANYRWVLKNTPNCELSDDAEFMSLHLGEAMNSVEELRAEAMRQGKKVDTSSVPETTSPAPKSVKDAAQKPAKGK